jgi:hypothetical protein
MKIQLLLIFYKINSNKHKYKKHATHINLKYSVNRKHLNNKI